MFKKLEQLELRYQELEEKLQNFSSDMMPEERIECLKEHSQLSQSVNLYKKYKKIKSQLKYYEGVIAENKEDEDFIVLAKEELTGLKLEVTQLESTLKQLLIPVDPMDEKSVVMEIRPAAGGDEAALFADDLFAMYSHYANKKNWKMEILSTSKGNSGGFKEIVCAISGKNVYKDLKYESGVHRVQRVPKTESQGRIHTSTVTVVVLPSADAVDVKINPSDLRIDTFRSSGAGGQHVNTTDSAIRIVHLPTQTVVQCQDEKSQHANKEKAMKVLFARLYDQQIQKQKEEESKTRLSQIGSGDRSEKVRTYNFPQARITDHRIALTLYSLDLIMKGDLELLIEPLRVKHTEELIANTKDKEGISNEGDEKK